MPIGKDVKIGRGTKIYHPSSVNLYGCKIGEECIIGAFVEIREKVLIGNRVKIQAFAFIPEEVIVEDEAFIGPHVCFINDRYPRSTGENGELLAEKDWEVIPTVVRQKASIGANATILCGVEIGEGAMVGAGSVVTQNVPSWTIVAGNPARVIRSIKPIKNEEVNKIPLVDLSSQYQNIKLEIDDSLYKIFLKGDFILGEEVEKFEKDFARFCKVKYCVGVASGTDAILLSLHAMGLRAGDEVITVPNTFVATVFPIVTLGAKPILSEIDPETYQMDPMALEKAISKKTKAIIPVHLYGIPAPMDKIMKIARRHKLFVLEDACQAHGSEFAGKKCGSFGDAAAFSFFPGKNLGAAGDAGAIVTNNKRLAETIRGMRNVGQFVKYKHDVFGYNSRLDTIHAAILSIKLKRLNEWNNNRRKLAGLYDKLLSDLPVILPPTSNEKSLVNYYLYVIRTKKRDELKKFLEKNDVYCGIHYPIPVHLQRSLKHLGYKKGDFPVTEQYAKEILSLPIYPELNKEKVEHICKLVGKFFKGEK